MTAATRKSDRRPASAPLGVRLLGTLDTGQLEGLRVPEQLSSLLDRHAARVRLGVLTGQERQELLAEDAYAALHPVLADESDVLLGRIMVAWRPLREALDRSGSEQATDRVALLRAVTDWYRVRLPRLLGHDVLSYLYRAYRRELTGATPDSPVSAASFGDALRWATEPHGEQPRMIDPQDVPGGQRYAPYPLLAVIADDPGEDVNWPVGDALWSYCDRFSMVTSAATSATARWPGAHCLPPLACRTTTVLRSILTPTISSRDSSLTTVNGQKVATGLRRRSVLATLTRRPWPWSASAPWNNSRATPARPGTGTSRPATPATLRRPAPAQERR